MPGDSLAGLAPQPPAEGPVELTVWHWLAGVEDKENDLMGDVDSDSEGEEKEDTSD